VSSPFVRIVVMRNRLPVWVALAGFLLAGPLAATASAGDADADLAKLEGRWRVVRYETDGRWLGEDTLRTFGVLTFSEGRYRWDAGEWGTVSLESRGSPRRVDYSAHGAEVDSIGIYQLLGHDFFRDCFVPAGSPRPQTFATKPGDGIECLVYQRLPNGS
jgi:uncharacterized protein (TIGR03067 family)